MTGAATDPAAGPRVAAAGRPLPPVTLVLGGARSGKSRYAEALVERLPARVYLATAEARDGEMADRIARHRARRGAGWSTVEAPVDLAEAVAAAAGPGRAVLVDCLTLWLGNLMEAGRDIDVEAGRLSEALGAVAGPVVLVSNEVGHGIVPDNALARRFRDHAGRLHQAVAAVAASVVFVAAGLPVALKPTAQPELLP